MKWKIYYEGGNTFSDEDGSIWEAPTSGVLVVARENKEVGKVLIYGQSYYFYWEKHGWWGGNILGLFDYLNRPGMKKVLFGREVPNEEWDETIKKATEDNYLPLKTANHPLEKRFSYIKD